MTAARTQREPEELRVWEMVDSMANLSPRLNRFYHDSVIAGNIRLPAGNLRRRGPVASLEHLYFILY